MPTVKIICLTPVMNEAWILERFLACASTWADHIIIADQNSTDGSREICDKFPKVIVVENKSMVFNEPERQKLLIEAARKIDGPRLLIALDADEFLTANFSSSIEWQTILKAEPGVSFKFHWVTVVDETASYWIYPHRMVFALMDDGSEHRGLPMHSPRLPIPRNGKEVLLNEIKILHYAFVDANRMKSKHRWYQCIERLKRLRRPIDIYRFNHKDTFSIPREKIHPVPNDWLYGYEANGIDMTSIQTSRFYQWDQLVLKLFNEHGLDAFRKLSIWDVDWNYLYSEIHGVSPPIPIKDPRTMLDKAFSAWIRHTQPYFCQYGPQANAFRQFYFRVVRKFLKIFGW